MAILPTDPPAHRGLSRSDILGYIADYAQSLVTGTSPELPSAPPVHRGLSQGEKLGFIADTLQDRLAP